MGMKNKQIIKDLESRVEEMKEREQAFLYMLAGFVQIVLKDVALQHSEDIQKDFFLRFNVNAMASFATKWVTDYWKGLRIEEGIEDNPFVQSWMKHNQEFLQPLYKEEYEKLKIKDEEEDNKPGNFYS